MIFIARPITAHHVREVCGRFNEGVRVEYKATFDANVREQLPKIVSSFANSQGGVLVIGVRAVNGIPQGPYDGFAAAPREEYPLTVENICLRNIHPPLFPRTEVVQSDVSGHVFLVIEVDESGESPHAIENSRKVYVRTGNAANPYDLAEVDLIIDLMKRRREPIERQVRLLASAERGSIQCVSPERPFVKISICPTFPRRPLCTTQQAWEFLLASRNVLNFAYANYLRRIQDGAASVWAENADQPRVSSQYEELNIYGLLFASRQFRFVNWAARDDRHQLQFADLFQPLLRMIVLAGRFFSANGYSGNLTVNVSLNVVQGQAMRFVGPQDIFDVNSPDDFRCFADVVSTQQLILFERLRNQRLEVLTDILSELSWAFWQSFQEPPVARLRLLVQTMVDEAGV